MSGEQKPNSPDTAAVVRPPPLGRWVSICAGDYQTIAYQKAPGIWIELDGGVFQERPRAWTTRWR